MVEQMKEMVEVVQTELTEVTVDRVSLFLEDQVQLHLLLVQVRLQQFQLTLVVIN